MPVTGARTTPVKKVGTDHAAILRDAFVFRADPADWDAVIRTNLSAAFYLINATSGIMREQGKAGRGGKGGQGSGATGGSSGAADSDGGKGGDGSGYGASGAGGGAGSVG